MEPGEESLQFFLRPLGKALHASVVAVADPAGEAQPGGLGLGGGAEEDALDAAADDGMELGHEATNYQMKKILAIDVGTKRIGVAGTDALGLTIQPLEVIARRSPEADTARICALVRERGVTTVVVGLPLRGEGEVGLQAQKVRAFAVQLGAAMEREGLSAEIVEWDESMTTHEAEDKLREAGVRRARRGKMIDAMAAAMILESYLHAHNR